MRVLVCGGRSFDDAKTVGFVLAPLGVTSVIHGGARGADMLGHMWAVENNVTSVAFPADWHKHDRAAGPIRNQQMLDDGKPDLVVAFPGGKGTADMVKRARKAGVPVIEAIKDETAPHPPDRTNQP